MLELEKHLVHKSKELSRRKSPFLNQFILCLNMNCFEPLYTIVKEKVPPLTESHMECAWESCNDSSNPGSPKKNLPGNPLYVFLIKKQNVEEINRRRYFRNHGYYVKHNTKEILRIRGVAGLWVLSTAVGGSRRRAWTASRRRRWESAPAWRARLSSADPFRRRVRQ